MIDVGSYVNALAAFVDPATGAPRLACGTSGEFDSEKRTYTGDVRVFDPVAGGEALLVIDVGSEALAVFADPATGAPRLACGTFNRGKTYVLVFDPVAGGEALVVIDAGASALAAFVDPAKGELRLACGCSDGKVRIYDPVTGGEVLLVLEVE